MLRILTFLFIVVCFFIFLWTYWIWVMHYARRRGLVPPPGKATMFDVRRLLLKREKGLAIRLYREIFKSNYEEAKKAVEELERSIQQKDSKLE